jgi:antitoxin component YwqK of YwqJK toxin-antitoxin module
MFFRLFYVLAFILFSLNAKSQNWDSDDLLDTLYSESGKLLSIENLSKTHKEEILFEYNSEGLLESTIFLTQKDGVQYEKITTYFANGNILSESYYYIRGRLFYVVSEQDSTYTEFYETGELKTKSNYIKNKVHGKWIIYFTDGDIATEMNFNHGKLIEVKSFDRNGNQLDIGSFKNGTGELIIYENGNKIGTCRYRKGRLIKRTCNCL